MTEPSRSPVGCTMQQPSPDQFSKWCKKRKILWPKCTMAMSQTTGRCLVAKQLISKDQVVVEVPDDAVLMAETSQIHELLAETGLVKPAEDALLEVQGLILGVMYEKALGKKSNWEPYLSFLPTDMTHMPIYWEDSEVAELRGTAAYDKLMGRVQHPADTPTRVPQLFEELVLPLVQAYGPLCSVLCGGEGPDDLTEYAARELLWPQYLWASAVVASYSFVLGDDQYQGMVPVWDLLNHITGKVNARLHHDADRGVLQMIATEGIPKGAEVVNCYGKLSNAELLRGYGYVEQHNSHKHVHIPAQFLLKAVAGVKAVALSEKAAASKGSRGKKQQSSHRNSNNQSISGGHVQADKSVGNESHSCDEPPFEHRAGSHSSDGSRQGSEEGNDNSSEQHSKNGREDPEQEQEPDWDLEDDTEQELQLQQQQRQQWQQQSKEHKRQQKQQQWLGQEQQVVASLAAAQQLLPDWEDRWQLCINLKLLPKNNVLQVPAGGLAALPTRLLPALLVLLADPQDCELLAAAVEAAATDAAPRSCNHDCNHTAACKHGSGKASEASWKGSKGGTGGYDAQAAVCDAAATAGHNSTTAAIGGIQQLLPSFQSVKPEVILAALQLLVDLMLSRYTCSLADDQQLLSNLRQLPPRLAAAVIARSDEKQVLHELAQALQQLGAALQLKQQAQQQVLQLAMRQLSAAAAAACGDGDNDHKAHDSDHPHEQNHQPSQRQHGRDRYKDQSHKQQTEKQQQQQQLSGDRKQHGSKKNKKQCPKQHDGQRFSISPVKQEKLKGKRTRRRSKAGEEPLKVQKQLVAKGVAAGNASSAANQAFAFNFAL